MTGRTLIALNILLMFSNAASSAPEIGVRREPPIKWIGDHMDRQAITEDLGKAEEALRAFSLANHLEAGLRKLHIEHIEIFATKSAFDQRLKVVDKLPSTTTLPATYVAVVNRGVLYACSDQAAMDSNAALKTQADYIKLLTHEMAHALHIALVSGDEARMGPRWVLRRLRCCGSRTVRKRAADLSYAIYGNRVLARESRLSAIRSSGKKAGGELSAYGTYNAR